MEASNSDSFTSSNAGLSTGAEPEFVIHEVTPTDTIAGLAIKYNTSMKEIKRKNRVFTDGLIFAKHYLKIPINSTTNGALLRSSNPPEHVLDSFHSESSKQSQDLLYSTNSTILGIEDDYLYFTEHLPCDIELISLKKT